MTPLKKSLAQELRYHLNRVKEIQGLIRERKRITGTGYQKFNQVLKIKGIPSYQVHRDRKTNGDLSIKIGGRTPDKDLAKFADRVKIYQSSSYIYGDHKTARYIFANVPRRGSK